MIVITAAHCLHGKKIEDLSVRSGSSYWNHGGQSVNITKSVSHAKYNYSSFTHDIAVLLLSSPLKFDNFTRNVELAESTPKAGTPALLSGWGIKYFGPSAKGPDKLQALTVFVKDRKKCKKAYNLLAELLAEEHYDIPEDNICASSSDKGACKGDSGGPLVTLLPTKLIGIVSSGFRCLTPSLYTDVTFFKTWIERTVKSFACSPLKDYQ
ncbi:trypsin epsilon-like [Drosophila takahashii]|uniref:trypsin epsilon-like n=1 Tax=Drosophila takahashii TaxID=29030 RepID=UPI001CF915AA|nr:trypsin epsilon-like [Drosophila takahashii]